MSTVAPDTVTRRVRRQYEALPYPHRDPAEESRRLITTTCDDLHQLNCYCFGGRCKFGPGFRVLVAGGGTGDATVFLAEQLRDRGAEIVHLDISTASIEVARERARQRGLHRNIQWIEQSLLELPKLDLGEFDYINCSGVLHHLEDPSAGLHALTSVLKPDGAMMLMLYGKYARTGVYQMQELLRLLVQDEDDPTDMVRVARQTIASAPDSNWFRRGGPLFINAENGSDAETYDLLLHSQDRAYSILEVYQLLDEVGLKLIEFVPEFRLCFEPALAFADPEVRAQIELLPRALVHHACELMWGAVKKHAFWASRSDATLCNPRDDLAVPVFARQAESCGVQASIRATRGDCWTMEVSFTLGLTLTLDVPLNAITRPFFDLVDGRRTMGQIVAAIGRAVPSAPPEEIRQTCLGVWNTLRAHDLMLMRHQSGG